MPANGSITCIYAAPLQSTQGGTNVATAVGSLNGVDVSDCRDSGLHRQRDAELRDQQDREGRRRQEHLERDQRAPPRSPTTSSSRCSSQGRTNVVDLLGDNPSTPQVETDYELDTDSASVTVRCTSTPPPPTDVCPNIDGNQATVPAGMVKDGQGNCVTPPPRLRR